MSRNGFIAHVVYAPREQDFARAIGKLRDSRFDPSSAGVYSHHHVRTEMGVPEEPPHP